MSERILEIVIFLMDYMRSDQDRFADTADFSLTLRNMGYSDNEISSAYFWLMNRFDNAPEEIFADFPMMHHAMRVLSQEERLQLSTGAYGLLLKLLNLALIDDEDLETILERVNIFGAEPISKDQIKMVASSIVFDDFNDLGDLDALNTKTGRSMLVN